MSSEKQNTLWFFSYGRNAIFAALKLLNLREGDEILTPAWDCDGTLEPFRAIGAIPIFYKSDPLTFEVNLMDIESKITPNTKLIHIINHFGQSQHWDKILLFRRKTEIPILEDNAYSFFSSYKGQKFGLFGDVSIFSIRKNFPIPDGGILYINNNMSYNYIFKKNKFLYKTEFSFIFNRSIFMLKKLFKLNEISIFKNLKNAKESSCISLPLFSSRPTEIPPIKRGGLSDDFASDTLRPMSKLSTFLFFHYFNKKIPLIVQSYRELYLFLSNELEGQKGIKVLFPFLRDGVVPYCLNVLVDRNRDDVLIFLAAKKYPVMAWPTIPHELIPDINQYPEVLLLGMKLLQINLKIDYSKKYYFRLITELKSVIK